jgi:hypothetical protein
MDSPLRVAIIIGSTREGRSGRPSPAGSPMLDQLAWWASALRLTRTARPYAA